VNHGSSDLTLRFSACVNPPSAPPPRPRATDEIVPRKLAETKKFCKQRIVQMEFGGQHAALLCVPKASQQSGAGPSAEGAAQ
jgi:hypothetical protein